MKRAKKVSKQQIEQLQSVINARQSSGREIKRAQTILLLDGDADIPDIHRLTGFRRSQIFELRNTLSRE